MLITLVVVIAILYYLLGFANWMYWLTVTGGYGCTWPWFFFHRVLAPIATIVIMYWSYRDRRVGK